MSSVSERLLEMFRGKKEKPPEGKVCKPCSACSEQKKAKDLCIVEKGEAKCAELIKAHEECLKKNGANINDTKAAK